MKTSVQVSLAAFIAAGLVSAYFFYKRGYGLPRSHNVNTRIRDPQDQPDRGVQSLQRCGSAPFIMPTSGFVGYLWDEPFRHGHRHQGIDIFGSSQPNHIPVYAAYDGYLSRLRDWKSSLIIRIPSDPLKPDRQIWTYYTHMADSYGNSFIPPDFPPGTSEVFVKAGTLLGYQGNYSGNPSQPVGVHLHFSIVQDDGTGKFRNELNIKNTYDPSPYFQLNLNAHNQQGRYLFAHHNLEA